MRPHVPPCCFPPRQYIWFLRAERARFALHIAQEHGTDGVWEVLLAEFDGPSDEDQRAVVEGYRRQAARHIAAWSVAAEAEDCELQERHADVTGDAVGGAEEDAAAAAAAAATEDAG